MKILIALSFLILMGCTNTDPVPARLHSNSEIAGNFSDDNFNSQYLKSIDTNVKNLMWDQLSSDFFSDGEG